MRRAAATLDVVRREEANQLAFDRLTRAQPVLIDVQKARDALPGMLPNMVLTGGPLLPWSEYEGAPRRAILYAAVYEGLAASADEADEKIRSGEIVVASAHAHGCVATNFAVCTSSMPVLVVEERTTGRRGCCNLFEGDAPRRLGTGFYGDDVVERLRFVDEVLAPTIGEAVRRVGGVPLMPILRKGTRLGDDMHVRTTATNHLFLQALLPAFRELESERQADVQLTVPFLEKEAYSFFRVWLAAAKAITDSATGIEGSSIVTAMSMSANNFAIRVSGLGDQWFLGPHPRFEGRIRLGSGGNDRVVERFHGPAQTDQEGEWVTPDQPLPAECRYPGTDCLLSESLGLGAFASASALSLQIWHGVSVELMADRNRALYDITWGEHPDYEIRRFGRGTPVGVDIFKVLERGLTPMLNGILIRKDCTIFGTGVCWPPVECFEAAAQAYRARYGDPA